MKESLVCLWVVCVFYYCDFVLFYGYLYHEWNFNIGFCNHAFPMLSQISPVQSMPHHPISLRSELLCDISEPASLWWGVVSPIPNPKLEAVSSIHNLRTQHAMVTRDTLDLSTYIIQNVIIYKCVSAPIGSEVVVRIKLIGCQTLNTCTVSVAYLCPTLLLLLLYVLCIYMHM